MGPARARPAGGAAAVLLAATAWGSTGTAAALAPAGASPVSIGSARVVCGGLLLFLLAWLHRGGGAGRRGGELRRLVTAGPAARAWAGAGAVSVAFYQLSFFAAVARTGVAVGTVVAIGSAPVFTGLVSRATGGPPLTGRWLLATAGAVAGTAVLVTGGRTAGVQLAGVALALAAGLSYAVYAVAAGRLITGGLSERAVMGGLFGGGALLLAPVLLAAPVGWLLTGRGGAIAGYLGVVTTAVAYLLYARGLRTLPVPVAVTLGLAEPAVAALLALAVLGEQLSVAAVAGLVLIGLALALLAIPGRRRDQPAEPVARRSGGRLAGWRER
jgi:DME family drug/metabolite transporter